MWLWLRLSPEAAVRMSARAAVIQTLDRGWEIHFHEGSLTVPHLSVGLVMTWLLPSPAACYPKERACHSILWGLASEVTYSISHTYDPVQHGARLQKSVDTRRQRSSGAILMAEWLP